MSRARSPCRATPSKCLERHADAVHHARPPERRPGGNLTLTWFLPAILKYRKLLGEVVLTSFFLQLFALLTPLFFQVVTDKVLVHKGVTTLHVLAIGMLALSGFETLLGGLRTYLFAHTSNRIDVGLGAQLFAHILRLPLAYFQARRTGDTVARARELDTIRQFLTSSALTVALDCFFTLVFFAVMLLLQSPLDPGGGRRLAGLRRAVAPRHPGPAHSSA